MLHQSSSNHSLRQDKMEASGVPEGGLWKQFNVFTSDNQGKQEVLFEDTKSARQTFRKLIRRTQSGRNHTPKTEREIRQERETQKVHLLIHDASLWNEFKEEIKKKRVVTNMALQQHMYKFVQERMPDEPLVSSSSNLAVSLKDKLEVKNDSGWMTSHRRFLPRLNEEQAQRNYKSTPTSSPRHKMTANVERNGLSSHCNMMDPSNYTSAKETPRRFLGRNSSVSGQNSSLKPTAKTKLRKFFHGSAKPQTTEPLSDMRALGQDNIKLKKQTTPIA